MKKIIELEIDSIISGDTGVDAVAFVEEPAIETEFIFFGRQKFYKAPDYVAKKACQAIKENEKRGNPAGTQVGKVRAQQLCNQSEISLETIKRMKSFLERAATYNTGDWDDNGTIAYGLWGGEGALTWVNKILNQVENEKMNIDTSNLPPYESYPTGDTKNNMLVKPIEFVDKIPGESKDDYLQRCIPVLRQEGYEQDQAVAICISEYENFSKCPKCKKDKFDIEPNPCWKGYEPIGLKPDGAPNCVPIKNTKEEFELLGYMDGIPYFSTPEEAIKYGQENYDCEGYHVHKDENNNDVYMSCETHDSLPDNAVELEDLLNEGWVIQEVNEVNPQELLNKVKDKYSKVTEQKFYTIFSDPNENSILDFAGSKIRFVYVSGMGNDLIKTSREFCRRMLGGKQYVFRYEDIMRLNAQIAIEDDDRKIIPRPVDTQVDIMDFKGGANCRHYWLELVFGNMNPNEGYDEKITNRKYDEIRKAVINTPATGQAGMVNPKANPQKGARDGFSKTELIPVGYIQGLPVFENEVDAQDFSYLNGCGGIIEPVTYVGKQMYQACAYNIKQEKSDYNQMVFSKTEEKRMVFGPLMIPNMLIPRLDEDTGERYFVKFKPSTIEKIQRKFMIDGYQRSTNIEHSENEILKDAVLVENWIVTSDNDKIYDMGFTKTQIPLGSWVGGFYILPSKEGDKIWQMIKMGKVKGFSVEGMFNLKFHMINEDEILLQQIIDIIRESES